MSTPTTNPEMAEPTLVSVEEQPLAVWNGYEKFIFRVAFLYILILCIPTEKAWYQFVFGIDLPYLDYRELNNIVAIFNPHFIDIPTESGTWGLASYVNLALALLLALMGALGWGYFDRARRDYNQLYYWIRVLARYRLAYALLAWGYKKVFLMQMVEPTVGLLNTPLIDMFAKRLYWNHVGIVPPYEIFLGFAEVVPGILLLFRRTTTLGAALACVVTANIWIANHAYEIGEQVASFYLFLLAAFIFWYDLPAIWKLLVREQDVSHTHHYPVLSYAWQRYTRRGLKLFFNGLFVVFFLISEWHGYYYDNYRLPHNPGLVGTEGYYQVTEFRLNKRLIPYSPFDSIRWQDATFESWSSFSFRVNRTQPIDRFIAVWFKNYPGREMEHSVARRDLDIGWEITGIGGGRHYYYYDAETVQHVLYLQNKNKAHPEQKQTLHYRRPSASRIILSGLNEFKDSIDVVLDRVDKKYPLREGRRVEGSF